MASNNSPISPQYIPIRAPGDPSRTLVLLLDGTGDKEDADVTNVILLRDSLYGWGNTANTDKQLVYYQQGIGTYHPRVNGQEIVVPVVGSASQVVDKAIAWSLPAHVAHVYRWLAEHYQPGDKISIFGFSRGAYTARALAGMLNAVALLPTDKLDHIDEAYDLYDRELPQRRTRDDPVSKEAWDKLVADFAAFKKENNCTVVNIDFLGCWDTVNSVGIIRPIKLKFTANNDIVRVFRHALALDEHRVRFKANMWGRPKPKGALGETPRIVTDVEEVWFAGCHCDVGGGSVPNHVRPNLAHIPLRWMVRECFKTNTGIIFNAESIKVFGINPSQLYPQVLPRPPALPAPKNATIPPPTSPGLVASVTKVIPDPLGLLKKPKGPGLAQVNVTEEELDLRDSLAPVYDQLELNPTIWSAMEYYPMVTEVFQKNAVYPELQFKEERVSHMGAGRTIPSGEDTHGNKIKVHRTVKTRMEATWQDGDDKGKKYVPKGRVGYDEKKEFNVVDDSEFEWVG